MQIRLLLLILLSASVAQGQQFDANGISRASLEYYLDRSVTMAEFLAVDPYGNDGPYPYKEDDVRMIKDLGAKFIGRAIYRWGHEKTLTNPDFLNKARGLMQEVHVFDPEVIFQAAVFEAVTIQVNEIPIPGWVFEALQLPEEKRHFRYADMLNKDGKFVNHWGKDRSVPDITQQESQLWLMYLCGLYINLGCEALHMGQISLMGMADNGLRTWSAFIDKVRAYAKTHSRRHWVLLDAHTPSGGMVVDGKSFLDFNSFPLRIKEVVNEPMRGVLEVGYLDAIYRKSKGCITPSGWRCDALPYLVEFDNFGISRNPGVADTSSHFIWGYDEVSWFYLQSETDRNNWLRYAYNWLAEHDQNGFLQMPVSRIVTIKRGTPMIRNRGNTKSSNCPVGINVEETVKSLWKK